MGFAGVGKAEVLAPDPSYLVFILTSAATISLACGKTHGLCVLVI